MKGEGGEGLALQAIGYYFLKFWETRHGEGTRLSSTLCVRKGVKDLLKALRSLLDSQREGNSRCPGKSRQYSGSLAIRNINKEQRGFSRAKEQKMQWGKFCCRKQYKTIFH